MGIHYRYAETADLPRCVELMRSWGRLDYGDALHDRLPRFWQPLIGHPHHALHVLVEDHAGAEPVVRGLASGVFVDPAFIAGELAAPSAGLSRRIIELTLEGRSPIATRAALASGQRGDGVHAIGVDFALQHDNFALPGTIRWLPTMLASARDWLAGWRLQSFHREVAGRDLYALAKTSAMPTRRLQPPAGTGRHDTRPRYLTGSMRADADRRVGALMWWFFQAGSPEFRFTAAQQDLLCFALRQMSDAEIAKRLGVSRHTVTMRWRTVLAHVSDLRPDLFPPHEPGMPRGTEKRGALLAHLRDRMHEIRPR
ncbi:MAG: hypothetical protein IT495_01690 [Gammaproteobacteria bacterium]|nr:hypothetical protein [Gammaproteobacteria bacterium]